MKSEVCRRSIRSSVNRLSAKINSFMNLTNDRGYSPSCQTVAPSAAARIRALMDADRSLGRPTTLTIFNYGGSPVAVPMR